MATAIAPIKRIRPKHKRTKWVAINRDNKIISEGSTADSVNKKALKLTQDFIITFVPAEDASYVL